MKLLPTPPVRTIVYGAIAAFFLPSAALGILLAATPAPEIISGTHAQFFTALAVNTLTLAFCTFNVAMFAPTHLAQNSARHFSLNRHNPLMLIPLLGLLSTTHAIAILLAAAPDISSSLRLLSLTLFPAALAIWIVPPRPIHAPASLYAIAVPGFPALGHTVAILHLPAHAVPTAIAIGAATAAHALHFATLIAILAGDRKFKPPG